MIIYYILVPPLMCQTCSVSCPAPRPQNQGDERSLALLDSTPSATPRALRLDRMTLTHPGALLDDPREFRRYGPARDATQRCEQRDL